MEGNGGRDSIDIGQLNDALNAKGADVECPVCHQADWNTSNALAVIPVNEGTRPLIEVNKGFETYCMVCGNCGFVRQHSVKLLHG